jgi:hypothetical protein
LPTEVILTCLLTGEPDPQRGRRWDSDASVLAALAASVEAHGRHLVVLTDCLGPMSAEGITYERVPPGGNVYWRRWVLYRDWLVEHPDVQWAWCVDGSDVEMLNDPFGRMRPDRLYVGSEDATLSHPTSGPWLCKGATDAVCEWLDAHPDLPVLNMGTLGGHRDVVLEAAGALADRAGESDWEIGAFQSIAYEQFAGRIVTGPMVHTRFHANERTEAWWKHK